MKKSKLFRGLSVMLALVLGTSAALPAMAAEPTVQIAVPEVAAGTSDDANTYAIYPIPQSIIYGGGDFTLKDVVIVAEEGIDVYTTDFVKEVLGDYNVSYKEAATVQSGKTNILLGIDGSKGVVDTYVNNNVEIIDDALYEKNDAYMLNASDDVIVIEGKDTDSVYYGVATLQMMFSSFGGEKFLDAHIEDYATVATRGYIEGFYGSWDWDSRADLMEFARDYKMNSYVYAAKNDSYHTNNWDDLYPASWLAEFEKLVEISRATKVEFGWSIHMGSFFNGLSLSNTAEYEARYAKLMAKFDQLYQIGVRDFDILNDDFGSGSHADVVTVLNRINADLKEKYADDPCDNISYCPQGYNKAWSGSGAELTALKNLDEDIYLYWTGDDVNSPITQSTVDFVTTRTNHEPDYWLNYPVNEHATAGIFLGDITYYARDGVTGLAGFHSNPCRYPYASEVGLYQLAALVWNNNNYSAYAQEIWESAFDYLQPEVTDAYFTIAKNIANAPNSSRVPGFNESEYLADAIAEVTSLLEAGEEIQTNTSAQALYEEFTNILSAIETFRKDCANEALVAELDPWLNSLNDIAAAGKAALRSIFAMENGDPSTAWEALGEASKSFDTAYGYTNPANNTAKAGSKRLYPFVTKVINIAKNNLTPILNPNDTTINPSFIGVMGTNEQADDANASNMYDGDASTYAGWQIVQKEGDYFGLDLGKVVKVTDIEILQGSEDGHHDIFHKATLQYSTDKENWKDVEGVEVSENGCTITADELDIEARYVRYYLYETGFGTKPDYWTFVREFTVNKEVPQYDRIYTNVEDLKTTPLTIQGTEVGVRDLANITLEPYDYVGVKFVEPQTVISFVKEIGDASGLTLEYSFNESDWHNAETADVPAGVKYFRLVNDTDDAITFNLDKIAMNVQYLRAEASLANATVSGSLIEGSYDNVFDGDLTTYALTGGKPATGNYITFDLGKTIDVYDVTIATTDGNEHLYNAKIQISKDNSTWTDIATVTGEESFTPPYRYINADGEGEAARYLRIYFTGASNYQLKLHEILINQDVEAGALSSEIVTSMSGNVNAMKDNDIATLFTATAKEGDYIEYRLSENASVSQVSILQGTGGKGIAYGYFGDQKIKLGDLKESVSIFDTREYASLTAVRIEWEEADEVSIHEISYSSEGNLTDDIGEYVEPIVLDAADESVVRNLAPGKTITVSGTSDGNKDQVNDGDTSTKWDSNAMKSGSTDTGDAWIYIDLGEEETYEISQIVVRYFNKIYPTSWVIQSSDDGENWTDVTDVMTKADNGPTHPVETVDFEEPFTARYVRLYFNTLNTAAAGNGVGITELEIYGKEIVETPVPTPTPTPTPTPNPDPWKNPFKDVSETKWYYNAVAWGSQKNVVAGIKEDMFYPSASCTRAQIVSFLWRAEGRPEPASAGCKFTDVNSSDWYYKAVLWATEKGYVAGYGDTIFAPDATCKRAEMVTFLWRMEGKKVPSSAENPFTDLPEKEWYTKAAQWAYENGVVSGYDTDDGKAFVPNNTIARAETVTMLYRFYN